mgnify:FL=1
MHSSHGGLGFGKSTQPRAAQSGVEGARRVTHPTCWNISTFLVMQALTRGQNEESCRKVDVSRDFESFVSAETPRLLGLAYALTGNPHDAWDLVQESLTRVGVRWKRLALDNPGGYARTTLVRLNIDRARRTRREVLSDAVPDGEALVEIVDPVDPWLIDALNTLTPQQRTAVVLRVLEDLDYDGLAEQLGCSIGTARSHLSRGLSRMRTRAEAREEVGGA